MSICTSGPSGGGTCQSGTSRNQAAGGLSGTGIVLLGSLIAASIAAAMRATGSAALLTPP